MKKILISVFIVTIFGIANTLIYANDAHHPKTEAQKSYAVKGEVVTVDNVAGKVKLKHEPVPELDWPAMTMFFEVADKSQLDVLKAGDQVKFEFVRKEGGAPLITQINTMK